MENNSGTISRSLFLPAVALLNRMNYTRKFSLLWMLSLIAIAVVVYSLFVSLDRVIQPSKRQMQGLALVEPISRALQAIQLHRGVSAALLGGNQTMRSLRAAKEDAAVKAFDAMEKRLPPGLASSEPFLRIKADWQLLRKAGLSWKIETNFAAHTRLLEQLHLFEIFVADEYLLTLDPEIASFYLIDTAIHKLPHAIEHLGQLRAYGTGILAKKRLADHQKIKLNNLIAELDSALYEFGVNLHKTGLHNPAIQGQLQAVADGIVRSANQVSDLVMSDILAGRYATSPDAFLTIATAEIDKAYAQMYNALLPTAGKLIEERIARAKNTLYTSIGLAFLAFLVVIYFSVSMYYAIIGNVQSLAQAARSFAGGNLNERIRLSTRDELSQVSESFNEMADGFNAMLEARKRAEKSLEKESHKNETLLRAASDGIHILDLEGNVLRVNDTFCEMLGYTAEELAAMNVTQWDAQLTAEQIRTKLTALKGDADMFETRHRRRDGSLIDVEVNIAKLDIDGQPMVYCSSRDVTKRKLAEQALIESQGKFQAVIETALDAVVQMDAEGIITGWNSQAESVFGWTQDEAVGQALHETIIPLQYRDAHVRGLKHFLLTGEGPMLNVRTEIVGLRRDGREFPVELAIAPIKLADRYEFSAFIRDITKKKESEDLIWRQANFDLLTGLPNRHMFNDRLAQEIKKSHRASLKMALLFVDLDKFKEVNDTLGHGMGDIMLTETARRIGKCVRDTDTVARLGGDEFIVILPELDDTGSVERVAENILRHLAEPFRLGDDVTYVTASIGITLYPVDATDGDNLLKHADQAMYAAKNGGRNRFSYFTPSMQHAAQTRLRMTNELRSALAANQFTIYYQPIVDLATGRINKAEALIRWQHPELGMIAPAKFIPLAEETGLIGEIGDWVFKESARHLKNWLSTYDPELKISVNVSPIQFGSSGNLCKAWLAHLQKLELPPQSVVIEITEGLLLKTESGITDKLIAFRDAGIQVAIDDFGTGYSALSYLKKFDIDYLKIDRTFVRDLVVDPNDMALSEAIIVMAHKLGLKVIAEGVETEEQRKLLADAGCDQAQGFLFSKPVPVDEFVKLLNSSR
jgi:diguanylate cyclase (GGDEF)-like protein/PAS domain S-box-containing protein